MGYFITHSGCPVIRQGLCTHKMMTSHVALLKYADLYRERNDTDWVSLNQMSILKSTTRKVMTHHVVFVHSK